jgi:hypothetical protein
MIYNLKMNLKRKSLILFFASVLLLLSTQVASADGVSLGIYPPILQIEALPPAKTEAPLSIINLNDQEVTLKITLKPFTASENENGEVQYLSEQDFFKDDPLLFQRIKILEDGEAITKLTLAPKQKKDLSVTIDIPKEETLSDYYFSIIFASTNTIEQDVNQSIAAGGIASNVLLSVGPKDMAKGNIEEYSVPYFVDSGPAPFTLRVKNKGSHFFAPKGEIIIKNLFGQSVGRVDLLPVNILAQSIRFIPDSLQHPSATGSAAAKYNALYVKYPHPTAFWYEKFLLGPYSANLTIALSDKGPLFKKTVYFFAFPVKVLLGVIIAALIIIFILQRVRKFEKKPKTSF